MKSLSEEPKKTQKYTYQASAIDALLLQMVPLQAYPRIM
jgi:hypothetical protein